MAIWKWLPQNQNWKWRVTFRWSSCPFCGTVWVWRNNVVGWFSQSEKIQSQRWQQLSLCSDRMAIYRRSGVRGWPNDYQETQCISTYQQRIFCEEINQVRQRGPLLHHTRTGLINNWLLFSPILSLSCQNATLLAWQNLLSRYLLEMTGLLSCLLLCSFQPLTIGDRQTNSRCL